ncbi:Hypothetical predicted protein [Xyrichtys novacula]|uniref:Uncharacterized protein n=1 Tax=Xyrichtys novacula TaxID=13765 RepID=A0AAV1HE87_XYRNO|nr:Hypothetical predicted protein [Xyrichtys novacula]
MQQTAGTESSSSWLMMPQAISQSNEDLARYIAHQSSKAEREANTVLQFQDSEHNTCGKRDCSQDIRQRLTVKQQN